MAIVDTIYKHNFIDGMRTARGDEFTYEALGEMFEYYDRYSEDIGEDVEFDPIGFSCEWTEYTDEELIKEFRGDDEDLMSRMASGDEDPLSDELGMEMERVIEEIVAELECSTSVIEVSNGNYLVMGY